MDFMKKTRVNFLQKTSTLVPQSVTIPVLSLVGARATRLVELFKRLCASIQTGNELNVLRGMTYCLYLYRTHLMVYLGRLKFDTGLKDLLITYELIFRSYVKTSTGEKFSFMQAFDQAFSRLEKKNQPFLLQELLIHLILTTDNLMHYGNVMQKSSGLTSENQQGILALCVKQTRFFVSTFRIDFLFDV